MLTNTVQALIHQFTTDLTKLIENEAQSIRERITGAIANMPPGKFDPGSVVKVSNTPITAGIKPRKSRPVFRCLRKNCKNVGAPIYGMVCTKHKNTPPAAIAKLKAQRAARAEK